jgi:hypothetical protein
VKSWYQMGSDIALDTGEVTDAARAGFDLSARADNGESAEADSTSERSITRQTTLVDFVLSEDADQASDDEISSEIQEDYALFTNPIAIDDPFAVAGVTWDSGYSLPNGSSIQMRTLDSGEWSEWYILEVADDGPANSRPGTEYNISGASLAIQARITRGEGDLPAGLRVDVSYSTDGDVSVNDGDDVAEVLPDAESLVNEPVNSESASKSAATSSSSDTILTSVTAINDVALASSVSASTANIQPRSAWDADESLMTGPEVYADFEGVIVHHTAGSNTYTQNDVASVIRGIYRYHAVTLGWGDIGYNVLIDRFGGRWEGRSGTLASPAAEMVIGGHAKPRNTGTMGVSVMGNFSDVDPNNEIITVSEDVIAWKFIESGVDPSSESPLTVPDSRSSSSDLVVGSSLPRTAGHLDVYWTACPARIYNYLDQIRSAVAKRFEDSLTRFYLNDNWTGTANIEFSWGAASDEVLVGDWDGDGVDTIALRRGNLYAFADEATPTGSPAFTVSYGKATDTVVVGDWDGDGVAR